MIDLLFLVLGITLLVGGGEVLVRGASALAHRLGVSPLVIGLTVVAFGTSAPELAVNLTAVATGRGEIAFGNIVGSNVANLGLVVGCAALVQPLTMQLTVLVREIPMMTLAAVAALVLAADGALGSGAEADVYGRADGLILLLFFAVFAYSTIGDSLRQRSASREARELEAAAQERAEGLRSTASSAGMVVLGLAGLLLGGKVTVDAASDLALRLGMSEAVVGFTVVAIGTSLPELATSLISIRRGQTDIAVGNVVGSNIFNLGFVLGLTSTSRPVPVPEGGLVDLLLVTGLSAGLLGLSVNPSRKVSRPAGAALLAVYAAYLAWRIF